MGDERKVKQVLLNLLSNAVDGMLAEPSTGYPNSRGNWYAPRSTSS